MDQNILSQAGDMLNDSPLSRVFSDIKENFAHVWKQGDMQAMSHLLRDETIKKLEEARKSINNVLNKFKNNIRASEAIDGLGALDNLLTILVNEIRNEEFGYGRVGDAFQVTLENLQKTLDYDGQIAERIGQLETLIHELESTSDDVIPIKVQEIKETIETLRRDLADRPNIMKGVN